MNTNIQHNPTSYTPHPSHHTQKTKSYQSKDKPNHQKPRKIKGLSLKITTNTHYKHPLQTHPTQRP
jgi:hypothetical protein